MLPLQEATSIDNLLSVLWNDGPIVPDDDDDDSDDEDWDEETDESDTDDDLLSREPVLLLS